MLMGTTKNGEMQSINFPTDLISIQTKMSKSAFNLSG